MHRSTPRPLRRLGLVVHALFVLSALAGCMPTPRTIPGTFGTRTGPVFNHYPTAHGPLLAAETGAPEGPLVILVHGSPGDWRSLLEVQSDPALGARALLVAVDRLGWGASGPGAPVASVADQAEALKALLDPHPDRLPAIVVGHSYGAPVVAKLAMDEPRRVGALILVSGSIDPALERTAWYQTVSRWRLVRWAVPQKLLQADAEIAPLKPQLEALLPGWSALRVPVTVIQGETDELVPAANADFARRVITGAPLQIELIPGQGHFIPWQRPELIRAAIARALDPLDAAPATPPAPSS